VKITRALEKPNLKIAERHYRSHPTNISESDLGTRNMLLRAASEKADILQWLRDLVAKTVLRLRAPLQELQWST
jgi:hypothetical protein